LALKGDFPGQVAYGYDTVDDGTVTMTDKNGKPAGEEIEMKFRHKLEPNEDVRSVSAMLTKKLRIALRPGGKAPVHGFEGPIAYPKLARDLG
jgi:hypothetical protein